MRISGNTIFLPGGTSGIGLGLALRLQAAGNTVIVGGRRTEVLEQLAERHGLDTVVIDTADAASVAEVSAEVITRFSDTNVLVAMAGIMLPEDVRGAGFLGTAEAIVTTNLLGPLRLIAAFTEHLQTRPDAAILTVSSGLAYVPLERTPTYNATKAAIHMFSESIRLQLADTGVQVVELVPPAVQTPLMGLEHEPSAMPLPEFLDEVMMLLSTQPDAEQILVERVKFLRNAEIEGRYAQVVGVLNAH